MERSMISIKDFQHIELRTVTITSAESHPDADRLLVLKVSLGEEERQVVAGIREHYSPEELVGKTVVLVSNLEPATIRGVESQGMILAASLDNTMTVLVPDRPIPPGAIVR
jgi:methionyl-tRNA synthetase